jgi:hypothetical protein
MNILANTDAGIHVGWYGDDGIDSSLVPGYGPDGVATFGLGLEHGYTLTWKWPSDIRPAAAGNEQREPRNRRPQESIQGGAFLIEAESADVRNKLAKHITKGLPFLIGLPHEALTLSVDSPGTVQSVNETSHSDWLNEGQRVLVVHNQQYVKAVVQAKAAQSVTLDRAAGSAGKRGAAIMPLMPVFLEPQQDFERYRTKVERWKVNARAAIFGFAPKRASLAIAPFTVSPGFAGMYVTAKEFGPIGNTRSFGLALGGTGTGQLIQPDGETQFNFEAGVTTIGDLVAALRVGSDYLMPTGTWDPTQILQAGDSFAFGVATLGDGEATGPVGTGAALTMHASMPVWDRRLINSGTNTDSISAPVQIVDHGGIPYAVSLADTPKWGRAIVHKQRGLAEWQWMKLFFVTVRGPARAFWLSTWREDLTVVASSGSTITVRGDVTTWWPRLREHLHVREANGSHVYCAITDATNNGDGTWDIITDAAPFTAPAGASWLELCRFAEESFTIAFSQGASFSLSTRALVVPQ